MEHPYELSTDERAVIIRASKSVKYAKNFVSDNEKQELRSCITDIAYIPRDKLSALMEAYGVNKNVRSLLVADWEAALSIGALRKFGKDTITFPLHVECREGVAAEVSIRRSKGQGRFPWCVCYVSKVSSKAGRRVVRDKDENDNNSRESQIRFVVPEKTSFYYQPGEYAYAKVDSFWASEDPIRYASTYRLKCIDGVSVASVTQSYIEQNFDSSKIVGSYIWVQLKKLRKSGSWGSAYFAFVTEKGADLEKAKKDEHSVFCELHSVGDRILAPIVSAGKNDVTVELGPNTDVLVQVPSAFERSPYAIVGSAAMFRIASLGDVGEIALVFDEKTKPISLSQMGLPANLERANIQPRIIDIVHDTALSEESLALLGSRGITLDDASSVDLQRFVNDCYLRELERGNVSSKKTHGMTIFEFDLGIRTTEGAPLSAGFKIDKNGYLQMNFFGFTKVTRFFDRDIYVSPSDWPGKLEELANLAIPEQWDYEGEDEVGKRYILKQYLRFTYYKVWLDGDIEISSKGNAVFNTGLVNNGYEYIYCYLTKNTDSRERKSCPWKIEGFACWAQRAMGKTISAEFSKKPKAPEYIDRDKLEYLYFDATRALDCDWPHIIEDNFSRLPLEMIEKEFSPSYFPDVCALVNDLNCASDDDFDEIQTKLKELIVENPSYLNRIESALKEATELAKKHVAWNYKTAVPVYYPRKNRLSLLLPLSLCEAGKADIALVVSRLDTGNYQGETIITLPMAYMDARQICRPNSEWLIPSFSSKDVERENE